MTWLISDTLANVLRRGGHVFTYSKSWCRPAKKTGYCRHRAPVGVFEINTIMLQHPAFTGTGPCCLTLLHP